MRVDSHDNDSLYRCTSISFNRAYIAFLTRSLGFFAAVNVFVPGDSAFKRFKRTPKRTSLMFVLGIADSLSDNVVEIDLIQWLWANRTFSLCRHCLRIAKWSLLGPISTW